jgi:hypothetical protein|tara:strand:- start:4323 stop:4562 length:240 start_codon:yes stop_codon:yes gene_type:complete
MDRIISVQILYYVEGKAEPLSLLLHKNYKGDNRWEIASNPHKITINSLLKQHLEENIQETEDLLDVKGMQKKRWKANKK